MVNSLNLVSNGEIFFWAFTGCSLQVYCRNQSNTGGPGASFGRFLLAVLLMVPAIKLSIAIPNATDNDFL
jgi:hypothetical protein